MSRISENGGCFIDAAVLVLRWRGRIYVDPCVALSARCLRATHGSSVLVHAEPGGKLVTSCRCHVTSHSVCVCLGSTSDAADAPERCPLRNASWC
jgi:hypothetical protein